jgi:hypothetical protein
MLVGAKMYIQHQAKGENSYEFLHSRIQRHVYLAIIVESDYLCGLYQHTVYLQQATFLLHMRCLDLRRLDTLSTGLGCMY